MFRTAKEEFAKSGCSGRQSKRKSTSSRCLFTSSDVLAINRSFCLVDTCWQSKVVVIPLIQPSRGKFFLK